MVEMIISRGHRRHRFRYGGTGVSAIDPCQSDRDGGEPPGHGPEPGPQRGGQAQCHRRHVPGEWQQLLTCAGVNWENGWVVFTDNVTQNGTIDAGEQTLQVYEGMPQGYTLRPGAYLCKLDRLPADRPDAGQRPGPGCRR